MKKEIVKLKSVPTIERQIRRLKRLVDDPCALGAHRANAYEAYHTLLWAIGKMPHTPVKMITE